ncbi:hypothetical protein [uncultured Rikenella sp.]|uniref:hypothetical protein n=1 Tax=uncultured Rikenella sp. TaxID=368003 RepID=UPI0026246FD4|nr:hypothetical protein [uncultured Rikenella sp.]
MPSGTAPGVRNYGTGGLDAVGREGSMWSASTKGTDGLGLRSVTNDYQPSWTHIRVYGFQLRCLSE